MAVLRRRGERRVALLGYSMGATMVTHYQALRAPPEVVGLVTLAHPLSLPGSLRRRWERFGARPRYEAMERRARALVGGEGEDAIVVVQRAAGPTDEPVDAEIWTYRTWWASRGPEATHAISAERIGQVRVPVVMIQAGADALVAPGEGQQLAALALAGGCPSARVIDVEGAGHVFAGHEPEVVSACEEALRAWL
jgi:pimeloyl-ACP methyl ester carboxylesterase